MLEKIMIVLIILLVMTGLWIWCVAMDGRENRPRMDMTEENTEED